MDLELNRFAVSRVNLYEQIADRLEKLILSSAFKEEKLPSEQTLADQFAVSRNVIREALKLLKERGLVESRNGTGSYITKPEPENLSDVIGRMVVLDNISYNDVFSVRIILETAACRAAAEKITDGQLKELEKLYEQMQDKSISLEQRCGMDFDFHLAIARAAGNPLLDILIQAMKKLYVSILEMSIIQNNTIEDAIVHHGQILELLKEHDAPKAEMAMKYHLETSRQKVERYLDKSNHSS